MAPMPDVLELFVVYDNPLDYPGSYVLRRQIVNRSGDIIPDSVPMVISHDVDTIRASVPRGLCNMGRFPGDDPSIMEVWI